MSRLSSVSQLIQVVTKTSMKTICIPCVTSSLLSFLQKQRISTADTNNAATTGVTIAAVSVRTEIFLFGDFIPLHGSPLLVSYLKTTKQLAILDTPQKKKTSNIRQHERATEIFQDFLWNRDQRYNSRCPCSGKLTFRIMMVHYEEGMELLRDPTNLKLSDRFVHNASGSVPSKWFPDKSLKKIISSWYMYLGCFLERQKERLTEE